MAIWAHRVRSRVNLFLLPMFTAGNLLPPQVIIVPVYYIFNALPSPLPTTGGSTTSASGSS